MVTAGMGVLLALAGSFAWGHFQVLLPSADIVTTGDTRTVELDILFTHPMQQGPVMDMARPARFGVLIDGEHHDLIDTLTPGDIPSSGAKTYRTSYRLAQPGDHVFYIEPEPYWEPSEQKMIVHYTKAVVSAFGAETGWDAMVGLPVEIEPLVRPYGLWTGNLFRGIVRHNGQPVPFATIEVEYLNTDGNVTIPSDAFTTQVIKADSNGLFAYAMPRAGWWGFAALITGDERMAGPDGQDVDVELGALMWVKCVDME